MRLTIGFYRLNYRFNYRLTTRAHEIGEITRSDTNVCYFNYSDGFRGAYMSKLKLYTLNISRLLYLSNDSIKL